jgi:hypothetical protein
MLETKQYTPLKKLFDNPASRDVTYQTFLRRDLILYGVIRPAQGEFGK